MAGTDDVRELLVQKVKLVDGNDYYALLGVGTASTKADVQKAYFELAKVLHPDKLAKHGIEDMKDEASRVFKVLSDAYNTLIDPKKRGEYEARRPAASTSGTSGSGGAPLPSRSTQELLRSKVTEVAADPKEAAKVLFHKGALLAKKGAFTQAEEFYRKAVEADADNPRYLLQLGWAIFQNLSIPVDQRMTDARKFLEKALAADPKNPEANYYVARYWKEAGKPDLSKKHLEAALTFRENYVEAKRELRLLNMRSGKQGSTTGEFKWPFGLDKLFKKKT